MGERASSPQSLPDEVIPASGTASAIGGIGYLTMVVGIIGALGIVLYVDIPGELRWYYGIAIAISSIISGMFFLGLAEVIQLFVQILYTLSELRQERRRQSRHRVRPISSGYHGGVRSKRQ